MTITTPTSPPYVTKQLTALFHTQPLFSSYGYWSVVPVIYMGIPVNAQHSKHLGIVTNWARHIGACRAVWVPVVAVHAIVQVDSQDLINTHTKNLRDACTYISTMTSNITQQQEIIISSNHNIFPLLILKVHMPK